MNKVKLLVIVSIGLLLANIVLIGLFLFRPPMGPGENTMPEPRRIIIDKLGFNEIQQEQFEKLVKTHRSEVKQLNDALNHSRKLLMKTLTESSAEIYIDSLKNDIGDNFKKIENTRYEHFAAIKKLCRPDQLDSFESLIIELPMLLRDGPAGRGGPSMGPERMQHPDGTDLEIKTGSGDNEDILPSRVQRKKRRLDTLDIEWQEQPQRPQKTRNDLRMNEEKGDFPPFDPNRRQPRPGRHHDSMGHPRQGRPPGPPPTGYP